MAKKTRMSAGERREQLVTVGRAVFAERGYEGTSVEEIAQRAEVSKPVLYEHFGGKEGLYAVIVDREVQRLTQTITRSLDQANRPREIVEGTALALFEYIDEHTDGFRILVRDAPRGFLPGERGQHAAGSLSSVIGDVAGQVEHLLAERFDEAGFDPDWAPIYAQMLTGLIALTGSWWLEEREPDRRTMATHLVNLTWYGMRDLRPDAQLRYFPAE